MMRIRYECKITWGGEETSCCPLGRWARPPTRKAASRRGWPRRRRPPLRRRPNDKQEGNSLSGLRPGHGYMVIWSAIIQIIAYGPLFSISPGPSDHMFRIHQHIYTVSRPLANLRSVPFVLNVQSSKVCCTGQVDQNWFSTG